jgi:predicted metalloenzyme YecM
MKDTIGDYQAFFSLQLGRLNDIHINISGCEISHLAYRTETYDEYLWTRERIERQCESNFENLWNGRPISIMQLKEPLVLGDGFEVRKMGLEHVGVVIGDSVDEFSRKHRAELTGQQFQSELCEPYYVTFFDDFTMVKFYRIPLLEVRERERGGRDEGFSHVENWNPSS